MKCPLCEGEIPPETIRCETCGMFITSNIPLVAIPPEEHIGPKKGQLVEPTEAEYAYHMAHPD